LLEGVVISNSKIKCFVNVPLIGKELPIEARIDLFEVLSEKGLEYYNTKGELIYRGKLAQAADIQNGPRPPIGPINDSYEWNQAGNCCKPGAKDSYCIGNKCP
jgi:hypothetical protein